MTSVDSTDSDDDMGDIHLFPITDIGSFEDSEAESHTQSETESARDA